MTSYHAAKMVANIMESADKVLSCTKLMQEEYRELGLEIENVELGSWRSAVLAVQKAAQDFEVQHQKASKDILKKGLPIVTTEDFERLNLGVTRR